MAIASIPLTNVNANRLQYALIQRRHARSGNGRSVDVVAADWIANRAAMFRAFYSRRTSGGR